jgi:mannose-6-phosphate isomerase-like protein (cupin superfamily)
MTVSLSTVETGGKYAIMDIVHPPHVGPALHVHNRGPESFFIISGTYVFVRGEQRITLGVGEAISIPAGVAHRYVTGSEGGRALVVCPPDLEYYNESVAELLQAGALSLEGEFAIAKRYGQEFLNDAAHWDVT